jgi:hypothetical protein
MMVKITRRKDLPDLPFQPYRAIPKNVTAVQLTEAEDVPNSFATGDTFHGKPGDWKITYGTNADGSPNAAICAQEIFNKTYEHVEDDQYRKKTATVIDAIQLEAPLDIVTLEGPSHGKPGDWLIIGVEGEPYFTDNAYFQSRYTPLD